MKKMILLAALSLPVISGCATNGVGPIAKIIYSAQTPDTTIDTCQNQSFIGGTVQRFESAVFGTTGLKPYYCGSQQFCIAKGYLHSAISLDKSGNIAAIECWKSLDDVPPSIRAKQVDLKKLYMEEQLKKAGLPATPATEVQP
jgi:hypothetical protein